MGNMVYKASTTRQVDLDPNSTFNTVFDGWGMSLYYDIIELYSKMTEEQKVKYIQLLFGTDGCDLNIVRYYVKIPIEHPNADSGDLPADAEVSSRFNLDDSDAIQLHFIEKITEVTGKDVGVHIYSNFLEKTDISTYISTIMECIHYLEPKVKVLSINPFYVEPNIVTPYTNDAIDESYEQEVTNLLKFYLDESRYDIKIIGVNDSTSTHWDTMDTRLGKQKLSSSIEVVDGGFYIVKPEYKESLELKGGIGLAKHVCSDINNLKARCWNLWQPSGGIIIGYPDIVTTFQYEVLKLFSGHIKEGYTIIEQDIKHAEDMLAAKSPDENKIAIVIVNDSKYTKKFSFNINKLTSHRTVKNIFIKTIIDNSITTTELKMAKQDKLKIYISSSTVNVICIETEEPEVITKDITSYGVEVVGAHDVSPGLKAEVGTYEYKEQPLLNWKEWELKMTNPSDIKYFHKSDTEPKVVTFGTTCGTIYPQFSGISKIERLSTGNNTKCLVNVILSFSGKQDIATTCMMLLSDYYENMKIIKEGTNLVLEYINHNSVYVRNVLLDDIVEHRKLELEVLLDKDTIRVKVNKNAHTSIVWLVPQEDPEYTLHVCCRTEQLESKEEHVPSIVNMHYLNIDKETKEYKKRESRVSMEAVRTSLAQLLADVNLMEEDL